MTDYRNFQVDDFIEDPLFLDWILENDTIATNFWKEWLLLNPDKHAIVQQAYELLLQKEEYTSTSKSPDLLTFQSTFVNIGTSKQHQIQKVNRSIRKKLLTVASLFVIVSGLGLFFFDKHTISAYQDLLTSFSILPPRFISTVNTQGTNIVVPLPDGSTVEVGPGSELNYPLFFSNEDREVYLNGSAYFKIAPEINKRPFRINASFISAETESGYFTIHALKKEDSIKIKVDSGNVNISSYQNYFMNQIVQWFKGDPTVETSVSSNQSAIVTRLGEVLINF